MKPEGAVIVSVFNIILNTLNTSFSRWTFTSAVTHMASQSTLLKVAVASSPTLMLGVVLYTVDIATGFASEMDRKRLKAKLENKRKAYSGGLWSWTPNIIYDGYTL